MAFSGTVATAQAENQTRSPQDLGNDFAHPGHLGGISQLPGACTGLKSGCINNRMRYYNGRAVYFETTRERLQPYQEKYCNFLWERCMKTGFWEGYYIYRPAERR